MNRFTNWFAASVGLAATVFYHPLFAVTIETVPVGNPGNVADSTQLRRGRRFVPGRRDGSNQRPIC